MTAKLTTLLAITGLTLLFVGTAWAAEPGGGSPGFGPTTGTDIKQLGDVIRRIINFLFGIAGAVAIILIIWGGIRYIMASGDEKATAAAKSTITFAVVGLVIILLAVLLVNILGNLFGTGNLNFIRIGPAT
ncbi:MAG TPA: hypothetical protein VFK94_06230 [Patescibacteria group bacterium]|nr:hypothetical protein [Patescibacteria group bacterium]